ncbi:hypothetical protein, partial [Rhizobium oryziradicis]|uniref:hypothetical protein n=1 Tax=Rhizobium oryziradicis TaxID=1867956 RepID=UPI001AECCAB4
QVQILPPQPILSLQQNPVRKSGGGFALTTKLRRLYVTAAPGAKLIKPPTTSLPAFSASQ